MGPSQTHYRGVVRALCQIAAKTGTSDFDWDSDYDARLQLVRIIVKFPNRPHVVIHINPHDKAEESPISDSDLATLIMVK